MRALEDIANQVRSNNARRYIDEAIAAYGASAYRSALIAVWIAVTADLIEKIRVLADEGHGVATTLREELNGAIDAGDKRRLQAFENNLLEVAHLKLELIGQREHAELVRLNEDRNLCAHPAYLTIDGDLYSPGPEQVRVHLSAAVDHVLSQPAVTGRKALERFQREATSHSFPGNDEALATYLRASYMDHSTVSLRANLIKLVCKGTLNRDNGVSLRWRLTRAARELQRITPFEFEVYARITLDRAQDNLDDDGLMALVSGLGYVPGTWDLLHDGTRARIEELLPKVSGPDLLSTHQLFYGPLPLAPLDQMLLDQVDRVVTETKRNLGALRGCLGTEPDRRLVAPLVRRLEADENGKDGDAIMRWLHAVAPAMTTDDLERIVDRVSEPIGMHTPADWAPYMEWIRASGPQGGRADDIWDRWDDALQAEQDEIAANESS